ncbi:MAG: SAM-dependent methyltransferase, partial [Limisphaerales bacterium]
VCLLGTPSLESQVYASPASKEGHVNCKDAAGFKFLMSKFFHNVFIFSMNDEVVHTGFHPMAHYLWALCCKRKEL